MKRFIDIEAEMQSHSSALDDIHEKLSKGETIVRYLLCISLNSLMLFPYSVMLYPVIMLAS